MEKSLPMIVQHADPSHFNALISLAREAEPLFGPMAHESSFHDALKGAISQRLVFCLPQADTDTLKGAIIISPDTNEIAWFVVTHTCRNQGIGNQLLDFALTRLDQTQEILVQTFAPSVPEGAPARALYLKSGFRDLRDGGLNPAGIPTVIMGRPGVGG